MAAAGLNRMSANVPLTSHSFLKRSEISKTSKQETEPLKKEEKSHTLKY